MQHLRRLLDRQSFELVGDIGWMFGALIVHGPSNLEQERCPRNAKSRP
jgi:hypothetical protein